METLYRDLAEDIKTIEEYNQSMDSASWGYEEGILITGNQAKAILQNTEQLQADKDELLSMLESVLELQKSNYGNGMKTHLAMISKSREIESLIQKHEK